VKDGVCYWNVTEFLTCEFTISKSNFPASWFYYDTSIFDLDSNLITEWFFPAYAGPLEHILYGNFIFDKCNNGAGDWLGFCTGFTFTHKARETSLEWNSRLRLNVGWRTESEIL